MLNSTTLMIMMDDGSHSFMGSVEVR